MCASARALADTHSDDRTHRVVFSDVAADVQKQFVADVDGVVDGAAPTGDVTTLHQAGLQLQSLQKKTMYTNVTSTTEAIRSILSL